MIRNQMNKEFEIEPRMVSTPWENKGTKEEFRLHLGSCPNDEKPMEETIKHR